MNPFNIFRKNQPLISQKPTIWFPGWKLEIWHNTLNEKNVYRMLSNKTTFKEQSDKSKQYLEGVIEKLQQQLSRASENDYINIENGLLIKKKDFIEASLHEN